MSFFFFFNNRKPRPFEHKPIYYNPQKKEQADLSREKGVLISSSFKGRFVEGTTHLKRRISKRFKEKK
jgi:hypothetical protein